MPRLKYEEIVELTPPSPRDPTLDLMLWTEGLCGPFPYDVDTAHIPRDARLETLRLNMMVGHLRLLTNQRATQKLPFYHSPAVHKCVNALFERIVSLLAASSSIATETDGPPRLAKPKEPGPALVGSEHGSPAVSFTVSQDPAGDNLNVPMVIPGDGLPTIEGRESTRFELPDAVVQMSRFYPSLSSADIEREWDGLINTVLYRNCYVPISVTPLTVEQKRALLDALPKHAVWGSKAKEGPIAPMSEALSGARPFTLIPEGRCPWSGSLACAGQMRPTADEGSHDDEA